jgi:V-type H+-transporting ATPase proteolipid subunit
MGVMRPELIIRSLLPVIMAGIIALYGLVVGLMMNGVCMRNIYS